MFLGANLMKLKIQSLFFITAFFISAIFFNSSIANSPKYLEVEKAFTPSLIQDNEKITINFDIAPNYYLYQERFKYQAINSKIAEVDIPLGLEHNDEYMGSSHIYYNNTKLNFTLSETNTFPQIKITYQGCTEGMCYPPTTKTFTLDKITVSQIASPIKNHQAEAKSQIPEKLSLSENDSRSIYNKVKSGNFIVGLFTFFALGILLSLTPCMFPMYPIWSAIILGDRKKSMKTTLLFSFTYVQGMAIAFMLAGLTIASAGAKFHSFLQQPLVLAGFSTLFIILALSMFGLFNLALPSKFINRMQNLSEHQKGGSFIGVFMMGVISAIIASPCTTAPLMGALIFIVQDGNITRGAINLYVMAIGMGTPLFVIGLLGHKCLPKSGNWMNKIKVLCGFLMLAVPLFLMNSFIPTAIMYMLITTLSTACLIYLAIASNIKFGKLLAVLFLFIGIAVSIISFTCTTSTSKTSIFSQINTDSELNKALSLNKIVILDLRADWCRECIHYEETTFKDSKVQAAISDFALLFADVTDANNQAYELMTKYEIKGVPAILIFKDGKLIYQIDGYLNADDFTTTINNAISQ